MMPVKLPLNSTYEKMPWDDIDAVVFDVGNVLLTFSPKTVLEDLFPGQEDLHAVLMHKVFRSACWPMLDRGTLTNEEAAVAMAGPKGEHLAQIRFLLDNWKDLKQPVEEGIRTLKTCKAHGKKCFVLSNYHLDAFSYVEHKYDFFQLMDGFVVSARIKLLKPCPEIYHYLLDEHRLDGSRTLFIDDTPANIEGAMHCGIQGLCYRDKGELDAFFQP